MTESSVKVMVAIQVDEGDEQSRISVYPFNLGVHGILAFDHPVTSHFDIINILDTHPFNILLYLNADPEVINKLIDEDIFRFVDHVFVSGCKYCIPNALRLTEGFTYIPEPEDVDSLALKILEISNHTP